MGKQINKIPLVRFSEFKDDWKFINGNELFKTISNKKHDSDLPILAISQEFGAIPRHLINYNISVTANSVSSYKVVDVGDFIISLRSFQGGIEYSNYKGICSPAYIILRPTVEIEADFFKSHFKSYRYIQQLQSKLEGIRDGKMISYKYFSEIKLPFPQLPEQKKIAHFFSIVDQKLNQLQEKKNALELYKKGMMQQIFSQQLRFKDENGQAFPEWEVKKLGEVCEVNPKSQNLPNSFIYIDLESVENGRLIKEERISIDNSPSRAQRLLTRNDILFQMVRPYQKNNYFFDKYSLDYVASTGYAQIRTKNNSVFIYQMIHSQIFVNKVIVKCTGTSYPAINSTDLKSIKMELPNLKEQTKIASFLSKIDDKINTVTKKIEQTKAYKKGLLQKMFV